MKKILLLSLLVSFGLFGFSQNNRITVPKSLENFAVQKVKAIDNSLIVQTEVKHSPAKSVRTINEEEIGQTIYDLQTAQCTPYGRFVYYDDGTMGATWTIGTDAYTDRGTGYNFYNGTAWGPEPTARIENIKTGWPSYIALGPTGEMTIAHVSGTGPLVVCKRTTKGTGAWTQSTYAGPSGHQLWWTRMVSGGTDHNTIHLIGLTVPVANGGMTYLGQDGALCYSRSTDGGVTWDKSNVVLEGTGSAFYVSFNGDAYSLVEPKGNNMAIIYCDNQNDFFVMRSSDGGDTWQKTIIWENPYPYWNGTSTVDTFYCSDGSAHGAFDNNGLLHIVFGVNRAMADGTATTWFPFVDGIAYWNENLPTWTGGTQQEQKNCLDPDLLYQQGSLIGWMQDVNGNGQIDLVGATNSALGLYYLSPSSMPQLTIDQQNRIFVTYSGITEGFDNGIQQYRHIWARGSGDGGQTWGEFKDFTCDASHAYDECVFPVIAAKTDDYVHIIYQADNEPGLSIRGDLDPAGDNYIRHLKVPKTDFNLIQPPALSIGNVNINSAGTVIVPVNASNINNLGLFQFTINYDPSKLTFNGISNWYSGINAVTIGSSSPGKITCVWAAEDHGIFITNNTFFEMNFTASGSSALNWNDDPTPREFGDFNGNIFVPVYNNGGVNLILPPQPILSVTPANQNVNHLAGNTSFNVSNTGTGTMSYSAQVTTGNDWLTISNGATGGNNGTIDATYSQNNLSTSRVGTITITAPGAIGSPRQVTVTQATAPPPSPELTIGTVNTNPGTVIVPVTARNLINLGSFQFSISYDVSKLAYIKDTNWYAGITDVTINSSIPGKVSFVWAANTPVTILDNTFFELKFATNAAGTSIIAWSDNPTPREFADWDGNNFEPIYENGSVNCAIAPQHFVFEGGNPADPVWTIYLSDATLDGIDLQPMDEIAIFDGETMVGSLRLTEVLTPATWSSHYITAFQTLTNEPGYVPGHPFTFKCWDVSAQEEISYIHTTLTDPYGDAYTGNVFPPEDGQYSIAYLSFLSIVTQWYSLNTGYQFISSHVVPTNPDMTVILDDLLDNSLGFVRNSGGNMFRKIGPNWLNNIGNWVTVEGYLFKMNASEDFLIQGTPINAQTPIALSTGYQFISYLPKNPMSATTAFAGIMNDNLSFIRNSGGNMLRKLGPNWVNNIGNVVPGEGYLAKMNAPSTLIYPAGTKSGSIKNNMAIQHFNFEGGNAADPVYTIYISDATINGYSLQSGDEIGVFDGQTLVGSLALTQTPTSDNQTENAIPVFATLNSGEGFTANHPVTFKLWSQGQEYEGVNFTLSNPYGDAYTGKVFPNSDGVYSIASLTATLTGINRLDRTEVAVYPNPSNGTFTLELNSVKSQNFDVTVYNSLGVTVYQQLNLAANGKYSTEIGSGDLPEGIYTLTVTGKDTNYIKKIVIRK